MIYMTQTMKNNQSEIWKSVEKKMEMKTLSTY